MTISFVVRVCGRSDSELIQAIVKDVKGNLRALKISKWIRRVGTAAVVVGAPLLLI